MNWQRTLRLQRIPRHGLAVSAAVFTLVLYLGTGIATANAQQDDGSGAQRSGASADTELAIRHYRRGNTYNNLERYDDAIEEYRLSVAADPDMLDAYRNMGNIFMHQGREDEAIPMLIRFVRLYDGPPDTALRSALTNLSALLRERERYEEAIEFDLQSLRADRDNRSLIFLAGNAYLNAGETDKALRVYEEAVELHPDDAFLHRTLGRMYDEHGALEEALEHYRRAAELDTGSDFYRDLVQETMERIEWRERAASQ